MAPAWAAGLTVTTTGLNQQEKQAVKNDVEAAGGRYSPNLSKRTTHLVTPAVVGNLSDKLAAAAAAGSRFNARIVSIGWVAASAASKGMAAEVQYTPALPGTQQTPVAHNKPATPATHLQLSSASTACQQHHGGAEVSAAAPTPGGAAAAPQTPWVVHFSQMVDDSIYGMPEQPSPTAHKRLAEQLQEQQYQEQQQLLQPIAEEQSQDVTSAPPCSPLQQRAALSPGISPAAAAAATSTAGYGTGQQQVAAGARMQQSAQAAAAASAGALTPSAHTHGMIPRRPHVLQLPGAGAVAGTSSDAAALATAQHRATAAAAAAASGQHPASTSKAEKRRAAFGSMLVPAAAAAFKQTSIVQELLMDIADNRYSEYGNAALDIRSGVMGGAAVQHAGTPGYSDSTAAAAAAATGVAAAANVQKQVHQVLGQVQQQGWQPQRQPPVPADVSGRCGSVDELISALRRVTSDGGRSTSKLTTSPVPAVTAATAAAAATPGHGHRIPLQQQQQWQTPATRGASAAGVGAVPSFSSMRHMNSTVDELIGALQRVTDSRRRRTAEAAPEAAAAAGMHTPGEQQQQQQGGTANGSLFGSFNSVDDLIVALRRATSDNARTAAGLQGTPQGSQNPVTPRPNQQQQQQQRWPWEQAATTPKQQQQQEVQQGRAHVTECSVPVTPSNVDELILALRRATGDSRRSTAEAAPSSPGMHRWEPQQLWMRQQGSSQPGGSFGSIGSGDDLLGALRRATGDSRRGTAESAPDALPGTADTSAAAAAAVAAKQKAGAEQDPGAVAAAAATAGEPASLFSSMGSVDELLGALRRATGDSRWGTAESAPDAPAGTADTSAAAAGVVAVGQKAGIEQDSGASAAAAAAAEGPAGLFGSIGSVTELLGALRQAAGDSRRGADESAPDAPVITADTGAAAAVGAVAKQRSEEEQTLGDTVGDAAAEPAGLFGSLNSVDDLIQALRSATGDCMRDTGELVADSGRGTAAATHALQQQQGAVQDEQLQRSMAASDSVKRSSLGSCSNFEDVLGALLWATAGSRRGTAEAVAEAAAVPLESQPTQQQQQHTQWLPQFTPGNKQPGGVGCSPAHMSGSSINELVNSLRRATAETQGKLRTAAEAMTPLPPPPLPAAAATPAANTPAEASSRADMHALVAALRLVTGEDQVGGFSNAGAAGSVTSSRLSLTPQARGQALSDVQHEQQQQQQHNALIQQLLLQTQPGEHDEQLRFQQQGGSASYLKAAWGSSSGEETPAATADAVAVAAVSSSGGVEQLLAALRRTAVSGGVPAVDRVDDRLFGKLAEHAEVDFVTSKTSAAQLAQLLQGQQQQQQQQQQESVAARELQTPGTSSCRSPDAAAAVLDRMSADRAAAISTQQQQQQYTGAAEELDLSQSPLSARQRWHAEGCNQPELSLSQLVHALQSTGDGQAGREGGAQRDEDEAPSRAAPEAYTASSSAAGAAAAATEESEAWSAQHLDRVVNAASDSVDDASGHSDVYRFPTGTPAEEEQLPAAAEPPQQQQQQQHQQSAAEPAEAAAELPSEQQQAAADSAEEEAEAEPQQQQQPMPAVAAAPTGNPSEQQASAAATGLQPCSLSSMAVAFDHRIPAELRQELAAAATAAGGCVVPGQPHLGCGANAVVAEPQHAAQWLQLLMHIVSPAWLLKACRQQQQQGCRPQQQLMCLSPDVARALGQGGKQQGGHGGLQQHEDAAAGADDSGCAAGSLNHCSSARSAQTDTAAAHSTSSSTVPATAQVPGNCSSSKACRAVLAVPGGLSIDGMGLCGVSAAAGAGDPGQLQQQPLLMPPGLLEGVVWSVDQAPWSVGDEEAEAVILQGGASSITLLLPQDSSGLLGHAPVLVSPCQPCKGLTCSDVLQAIHSFYQQKVLLQQQPAAGTGAAGVDCSVCSGVECAKEQEHGEGGVVVRRLQLLGARLMLEGLVRATRDPCSCVYEVCLA